MWPRSPPAWRTATAGRPMCSGTSYGALCALGAAAGGAPFRRITLYEPPGPGGAAPREWRERASALVAAGLPGPAMVSFLTEVIGLTRTQIDELRNTPGAQDVLPIVSATMPREGEALASADLPAWRGWLPRRSCCCSGRPARPGRRTSRTRSAPRCPTPPWRCCRGVGHEAIDTDPGLLCLEVLLRFLAEASSLADDR